MVEKIGIAIWECRIATRNRFFFLLRPLFARFCEIGGNQKFDVQSAEQAQASVLKR
jgi:hypothetical protein